MPYYGDGLPYYYGGAFATHSSLMTGAPRPSTNTRYTQALLNPSSINSITSTKFKKPPGKLPGCSATGSTSCYSRRPFHTPLSRYSPHLSTITESPLTTLRRYSPVTLPARPRRVVDTADIDVSTPRILPEDGNRPRNRLRRDRPTIKIRSQALKDNPALRKHNERHEKSVGELLVEKFLIKEKRLDEDEKPLQLSHQFSPDREEEDDTEPITSRITRRFTRRRSSADVQLDPEQIEREVAYAQVQAKVLDTLVAEEQAEIQNEVRRGTLIKKGAPGGPRTAAGFFGNADGEVAPQGEEEAAAQKMRKTLKKLKKRKKSIEKPSPTEDVDGSSVSSDVSADLQAGENEEKRAEACSTQQIFKIEASNSVGDLSTLWVNGGVVEQFRESVKIPVPRKMAACRVDERRNGEESETEVVLPVKRPYVKDTSRNSVYFTVKTPPETLKNDPLKREIENVTNGAKVENEREPLNEKDSADVKPKSPGKGKVPPKLKKGDAQKAPEISPSKNDQKLPESPKSPNAPTTKNVDRATTKKRVEERPAMQSVDPLASEHSASAALPSTEDGLPKASKINTDENNAVEAPKRSLREPERLAMPTKVERDEDVASSLPGKEVSKAVTLKNASATSTPGAPNSCPEESPRKSNLSAKVSSSTDDATEKLVTKTTSPEGSRSDTKRNRSSEKSNGEVVERPMVDDGKSNKARGNSVEKIGDESNEEASRLSFKSVAKKTEASKVENKVADKVALKKTEGKEAKIPWGKKLSKVVGPAESSVPLNRSISADSQTVLTKKLKGSKSAKQSASLDESSVSKMPLEKPAMNGESGALFKSTSTESIDFWNEIRGPESPQVTKTASKGFSFANSESTESDRTVENLGEQLDKKKETDPKISVAALPAVLGNIPVIEEEPKTVSVPPKPKTEQRVSTPETLPAVVENSETDKNDTAPKKRLKKKTNLSIIIDQGSNQTYSTVKRAPLKREDSEASTISFKSETSTPDTAVLASDLSTPVSEISLPLINIVGTPTPTKLDSPNQDDEDEPKTPTNEWPEAGLFKISKWSKHSDLSNVNEAEKDVTPVPSKDASVACSPEDTPESSKKKKVVRKKKVSTTKKSSTKKESKKNGKESKKSSSKTVESLKPPEAKNSARTSPKNAPGPRPIDLMRMFYTTPSALLTATPRDLSKVRRAKIKRKKHQSRTPSMSSDSTGSTTSTATTESSGSTCTELDDDPEHKRMNSTRSNDSGFDGSPRISTPSQSSDTQRNSDSSDHFPSGRITPPATNLPRFKKYAVTDFQFLKVLGKGSFGKVLLAELRGTECVYAVKCLKKDVVLEDDDVECTLIERKVLTLATRHPYLCHLFCTFQTDSHLFFVMEYLNGGDLMFHIQKSGRFPEPRARFYAAEIWSGLNFLHKKGIVYRDLKLDNVLLDFEGHIRIADFGMCKLQIFLDRTADTFCGTPDYMAPEIIKGLKYNQAVDWWSYGVLLYEMLTGQSPFSGCDEDELFWSICNERPFIPRYLSQDSTDILVALLEKDSGKRLPGHEIAMHTFFQSLPWDRLERRQLDAPFKPALDHTLDTRYFDTAFTAERPRLTPVPEQIMTSMDQGVFRGFSYTNPNATD